MEIDLGLFDSRIMDLEYDYSRLDMIERDY
jgi:hypothetical protein